MKQSKVWLVGAGCGDYDLITLRGKRILEQADCVIYDALIDKGLLDFVPSGTKRISVGKRAGHHSATQEEINEIILESAEQYENVVRLKGGDSFIFGRGGEEILAMEEAGIDYELVPGISSSYAVAEMAGIPVTHRGVSRSFHVITGHLKENLLPEKMEHYARLEGTLVFLMGLGNIEYITSSLMAGGMDETTPAAVISDGASARARVVRGTVKNIAKRMKQMEINPPGIIVIGQTAAYDFSSKINKPLSGISVSLTGTGSFLNKSVREFSQAGAYVKRLDYLKIAPYENKEDVICALTHLPSYDWVVLTSANGANLFVKELKARKIDLRRLGHLKFAVIGSGTAKVLEDFGIYPDLVPEHFMTECLAETLVKEIPREERILILRAEQGSKVLNDILDKNSMSYTDIKTYDVVVNEEVLEEEIQTDYLMFASASGVSGFIKAGGKISSKTKVVCIGDVTKERFIREVLPNKIVTAKKQTIAGMIEAIRKEEENA